MMFSVMNLTYNKMNIRTTWTPFSKEHTQGFLTVIPFVGLKAEGPLRKMPFQYEEKSSPSVSIASSKFLSYLLLIVNILYTKVKLTLDVHPFY